MKWSQLTKESSNFKAKIFLPSAQKSWLGIRELYSEVKNAPDPGSGSATQEKINCVQEENECEEILVAGKKLVVLTFFCCHKFHKIYF